MVQANVRRDQPGRKSIGGLPVGFQVLGFANRDADLVGIARWLMANLPPVAV
jgi:Asp-tRNA(Asn)/Glu-tRNA(Gln) amidotransferase A subunit family amidase